VVVGAVLAHFAYYTLVIGGDHFEYRVYSHLILLLGVAAIWLLGRLRVHPRTALAVLLAWFLLSWPIPWTHWARTHRLTSREETRFLEMPVAPVLESRLPSSLRWTATPWRCFDRWQGWLIDHAVCMRHQEHKIFLQFLVEHSPARGTTRVDSLPGYVPVRAAKEVGYLSWVQPGVAIIDMLGLNDWVIARNPVLHERHLMGHERQAPSGYLECFDPALATTPRIVQVPVERVRDCERRFAAAEQE
jgi:arabinofuranosyltransferase